MQDNPVGREGVTGKGSRCRNVLLLALKNFPPHTKSTCPQMVELVFPSCGGRTADHSTSKTLQVTFSPSHCTSCFLLVDTHCFLNSVKSHKHMVLQFKKNKKNQKINRPVSLKTLQ